MYHQSNDGFWGPKQQNPQINYDANLGITTTMPGRGSIKLAREKFAQASRKQVLVSFIIAAISLILLFVGLAFVWRFREDIDNIHYYNKHGEWRDTCQKVCSAKFDVPPLILISLDGFRADYLERNITPAIQRLINCGTSAPYMYPSFPASTFPNHYTIATGLYPESHGIVDNRMFDEQMFNGTFQGEKNPEKIFSKDHEFNNSFGGWYNGEPIWNTVFLNGKKTGTFFWPGSEVQIKGMGPTYRAKYSNTVPFSHRVDTVIEWLSLPSSDRPSFFTLYFEQPDSAGHKFGPDSNEVNSNLIFVDAMLNYLFHRLDQQQLLGCINIVLVSDHGMQSLRPDHFIKLFEDEKIMNSKDTFIQATSAGHIYLKGDLAKLENPLEAFPHLMCQKGENYRVYSAKTMPRNRHYTGRRVGEIFLDTVIGAVPIEYKKKYDDWENKGGHGYNNVLKASDFCFSNETPLFQSMRAIFGALGPSFKTKTTIPPFQNIELYNLFVDVMQLPHRAPNNGTHGTLFTVLKNPPEYASSEAQVFPKCPSEVHLLKCGDSCHFKLPLSNETYCYSTQQLGYTEPLAGMSLCEMRICNASIMLDSEQKPIVTQSLIRHPFSNIDHRANCSLRIHDGNVTECQRKIFKGTISLFSKNSINYYFEQARIPAPKGFIDGAWKSLVDIISKYTQHYSTLRIWAGPIWDNDNNGLIDDERVGKNASHVFIVLLRCSAQNWANDFTHCKDETKTRVLSFILPLIEKDYNCLDPTVYLFQNMARVRDVELLTGFEFFVDRNIYSPKMALQLRTEVKEELWQLEQDIHR